MGEKEYLEEEDRSEFNAGIATLKRCDEIKKWIVVAKLSENIPLYYKHLDAFFTELYPMLSESKEVEKGISERRYFIDKSRQANNIFKKWKKEKKITFPDKDFLEEWELELRDIEQIKGMNLPKKADARFALAR